MWSAIVHIDMAGGIGVRHRARRAPVPVGLRICAQWLFRVQSCDVGLSDPLAPGQRRRGRTPLPAACHDAQGGRAADDGMP